MRDVNFCVHSTLSGREGKAEEEGEGEEESELTTVGGGREAGGRKRIKRPTRQSWR